MVHRNSLVQIVPDIVSAFLTLTALFLWVVALNSVDVNQMSDLGLVSILPIPAFAALLLLTISLSLALNQERLNTPLLFFNVAALIFMLYGATALIEDMPRFSVTWRHIGVIQFIRDNGHIDPHIDAYFNWPGFFTLSAFLTYSADLSNALSFGAWASVFFNLLYVGPLIMIFTSATDDKRIVWLAIWVFYLTNWIAQDYFSPQALNYFMYLVIVAILVRWFKTTTAESKKLPGPKRWGLAERGLQKINAWLSRAEIPVVPSEARQRAGLLLIVITIFVAVVASHQLTPFAILAAATALVIFNRNTLRGLPLIMGMIITVWFTYMAAAYLRGHLSTLLDEFGQVNSSVSTSVSQRLSGSPEHVLIVRLRLLTTFVVWGLAVGGGIQRFRKGYGDGTWVFLAAVPFGLVGLQDYGGEILLRIYLFGLPFVAFFIAALIYLFPVIRLQGRTVFLTIAVSAVLIGGFLFSRYGNERMDYKTADEIEAVQYLYSIAPADSIWLSVTPNVAWKFQDYDKYRYKIITDEFTRGDIDAVVRRMQDPQYTNGYLVLTRSQRVNAELFYGISSTEWERFEQDLIDTGQVNLLFSNRDAQIFGLADNVGDDDHAPGELSLTHRNVPPLSAFPMLAFLLVVPGWAFVSRLYLKDNLSTLVLSIALSLAIETVLVTAMIYTGTWRPWWILSGLVGISLVMLGIQWANRVGNRK